MDAAVANDAGLFVLRASVAYVYLHGAWMIAGSAGRRRLTAGRSLVLYRGTPWQGSAGLGRATALAATALMLLGGLGLLAGIATRPAAALLVLFTVPGIVVHLRELIQSGELVDQVAAHAPDAPAPLLARLKWSGYAGHRSSANKNWALIGAALFLILADDPDGWFSLAAAL